MAWGRGGRAVRALAGVALLAAAALLRPHARGFTAEARAQGFTGKWGSALLNADADPALSAALNETAHAHPWNRCRGGDAWISGGAGAWERAKEERVDEAGLWEALTHRESARYRGAAGGGGPAVAARVAAVPCAAAGGPGARACCARTFLLRPGTTDADVFAQIYLWHFLCFLYPLIDASFSPRYILDAGANAGFSAVLFALLWPNATVVALEPDAGNYAALAAQVTDLPRVRPVRGGLWGRRARVGLADAAAGEWGRVFAELPAASNRSADGGAEAYSVAGVAALFADVPAFDFVKIDIEGAEGAVFDPATADLSWVDAARVISLEVHDYFAENFGLPDVSSRVHAAMAGRPFEVVTDNEHVYYLAERAAAAAGLGGGAR